MYKNKTVTIQICRNEEDTKIGKGITQLCILSQILFIVYIEEAINELRIEQNKDFKQEEKLLLPLLTTQHLCRKKDLQNTLIKTDRILNNKYEKLLNKNMTKVKIGKRQL